MGGAPVRRWRCQPHRTRRFTGRGGATSGSYRTQGFDTNGPLGATSVAQVAMSPSTNSVPITIALEPV